MMEGITDEDLPWAEYLLPLNYQFTPNQKGDHVWVDFPYNGDTRRPRICGAAMDWQGDGKANVPAEAGGKGTAYTPPSGGDRPAGVKVTSQQDQVINRNKLLEVRSVGGGYQTANGAPASLREGIAHMFLVESVESDFNTFDEDFKLE
ncbi:hypothetical protein [Buttiauxella sp. S04-F03]|uniref:hypothetical protein n=1 Tax=Buttiauxella sp. S04-F03 TaxID=2904525 RepID=UPI001E55DFF3|nr:hypothetical protein [Buttiauxella sp. S04-F03]MCE0813704.1 hypothetical protein [Buttiauxella sp. S04-F03]